MRTAERRRLGVLVAGLSLAVAACAPLVQPLSTEPHLLDQVPSDVPGARLRLGVGLVTDARPRADRQLRRPPLRVQWYGLVRRGENQTGDASFEGSIAEGVRRDAAATLARSGAFSEVRMVAAGEDRAEARAAAGDVDLVLVGTLEELVGIQYQDSSFSFFLVGGIWNRLGEPIGLARIRYRVYGPSGLILEDRIETLHRSSQRTPAQAALDAAARSNERLAHRLFLRLIPEAERVRRTLPVRVLDRCGLGRERVEHLLREASGVFEREAGVRLRAQWVPSRGPALPDLTAALDAAKSEEPAPGGAVVSLVPLERPDRETRFGLSVPLGQHAVVACNEGGDVRVTTLAHEIGHLFGAVHVPNRTSVMHPVADFNGRFFDPLNRRILRAAWNRPFGSPLPSEVRSDLHTVYQAALRLSGGLDTEEIQRLVAVVGDGR